MGRGATCLGIVGASRPRAGRSRRGLAGPALDRLWPTPEVSKPPLHTLPDEALLVKLESLTNLRVARDAETPDGRKVELALFPGLREAPSWFTPASAPGTQEGE